MRLRDREIFAGRALVTGGAGFIGSHLAERLLREGWDVTLVDNLDNFYPESFKRRNLETIARAGPLRFYPADIRDSETLGAVFRKEQPEVVVHLAARAGVRPSIIQPKLYEEVNIGGTLNMLELARQFEVRKFVFGSSSSVYGASARVPFSECWTDLKPISPYAATKIAGELLSYTYAHLYDLPVVCLRFFTVYGPRQRPDLAIRKFTHLMMAGLPISVYGDGTAGRDYTFVDDIVEGIVAALSYETQFDIFNLGTAQPVTLLELIRGLEKTLGKPAILDFQPPQPGDVPLTWADLSKANQCLGYEPRTPLEDGLEQFWKWYGESTP
jgi:UDP-glucuronate 4-epimerase